MSGITGQAAIGYLRAVLGSRLRRLSQARQHKDLGASAIELAIITAVVVGLAVTVLVVINSVVTSRANQINSNNSQIP